MSRKTIQSQKHFDYVYKFRKISDTEFIRLYVAPAKYGESRVAFVASKRCGNAVLRNRSKRILREIFYNYHKINTLEYDIIFIAKSPIVTNNFKEIKQKINKQLDNL